MARMDAATAEWSSFTDDQTGRLVRQYTSAAAHSYPLYYFVPSVSAEGRYLVFHSERSGAVQLHRMDLADGTSIQLTEGTTRDSGWAMWCVYHLTGIHTHLSALNITNGDVYYFDNEQLRSVSVTTGEDRVVAEIKGRIPVGQSAFSPDGRLFVFVDADRDTFTRAYERREKRELANDFPWSEHDAWRNGVPTRIGIVDTCSGHVRTVVDLDYHVHHVLFTDNETVLVNHVRGGNGMWSIRVDGSNPRVLRPADDHGSVCHQVVIDGGVLYETSGVPGAADETWFGRYRFADDTWQEWRLPSGIGYVHTGNDPAGRWMFIEACARGRHALYQVRPRPDEDLADVSILRGLNPDVYDVLDFQRHHAHPFLSPDRRLLFYTDVIDGYSQICSIDVADLTGPARWPGDP